jgi:hypothetical protein
MVLSQQKGVVMAASIVSIAFVSSSATNVVGGPSPTSVLTVWFSVYQQGPAHVAGITVTANGWSMAQDVQAKWDHNQGTGEVWKATFSTQGANATFGYICWCEDFADVDNVKKIWNTNGGHQYWVTASY